MTYAVRPYRNDDAEALSALCREAIRVIGPRAYSAEQVAAWLARHPGADRYRERVENGATIFVAVDVSDQPVVYALLEPDGHLDHLYGDPQHTRAGLAQRVLEEAERYARAGGITRLYTEASELARAAFERAGYQTIRRCDFTITHDGYEVAIHNYAMEKSLR